MSTPTQDCRRDNLRIASTMTVRFSINDGPELSSTTINLTERSLAIKASTDVQKGDTVIARVDPLPSITGEVVRVWDEGFAMTLSKSSCALVALAHSSGANRQPAPGETKPALTRRNRVVSKISHPAETDSIWCRAVSSAIETARGGWAHKITIVKPDTVNTDAIRSLWLSIGDARWLARISQTRSRKDLIFITTSINGWQLQMASIHGLSITVVLQDLTEWKVQIGSRKIETHWRKLSQSGPVTDSDLDSDRQQRQAS